MRGTSPSVEALVAAAMPTEARSITGLLARLAAADTIRSISMRGQPMEPSALSGVEVRGVTEDSRTVGPGSLFVALPGFHVDGHAYAAHAADAGAAAIVVERPVANVAIPQLVVTSARPALAEAACWWFDDPSARLGMVGITGTDGKTTTSFLAAAALEAAGLRTGLVGTIETRVGTAVDRHEAHVTTPSAPELQALLAAMVAAGDDVGVVEATSHALALDRVRGVAWDAVVFTNLTHEHLELHGTFEAYRDAKVRLFEGVARTVGAGSGQGPGRRADPTLDEGKIVAGRRWPRIGVVNRDDPSAPWFERAGRAAGARIVGYGTSKAADVRATAVAEDPRRLHVEYLAPSGAASVDLRLAGRFNVHNALAVVALGEGLGLDPAAIRAGLEAVTAVPGRMERIEAGQPFAVVVDYAHSPASIEDVLDLLAPVARDAGGSLIAVFGSAGERDTGKRAVMGRIAAERCRLVVATDEDPRGEDPMAILEEIVLGAESAGARRGDTVLAIPDRREAIATAFGQARPGDVVLLAGKGHEQTILYEAGGIPWDEAGVARALLAELGYDAG
jgi:UDP-N-acetylmuramoyl-L-alanyl-D-glutamate--2,6-diaminopimelate ligase